MLESLRKSGRQILDLTASNPTCIGLEYPHKEILSAFSSESLLHYEPNPHGVLSAREAIREYYLRKNISVDPSNIFLSAGTSEAYSLIFKLLCNRGENVLVPGPSYPLFEYLADLNDVAVEYYYLQYENEWLIDIDSIGSAISNKTKAIVLINPHNPTGMFLRQNEYRGIAALAKENNLALIVDEVFIDYAFDEDEKRIASIAEKADVLTFSLNGISKMIGLPQMKLAWIIVNGPSSLVGGAVARLEIICDTFLSVNTPVQVALPQLLDCGKIVRQKILDRIRLNYSELKTATDNTPCSTLNAHGGWYGIVRVPGIKSDEDWALELLEAKGVYLFPGYFFDFDKEGFLVVSLLVENSIFRKGVAEMVDLLSAN